MLNLNWNILKYPERGYRNTQFEYWQESMRTIWWYLIELEVYMAVDWASDT